MSGKPIYLSGPIQGRTIADSGAWRKQAATLLAPLPVLDPLKRNYDGSNVQQVVESDLADIRDSCALLVMFDRLSVGTAMEIFYASSVLRTPVYVIDISHSERSPWLIYHTTQFFDTLDQACTAMREKFL